MLNIKTKIIKQLHKKRKGTFGCMILSLFLIMAVVSITFYKVEERRCYYAKQTTDNAVILSLQSANVVDLYEFATRSVVLYDAYNQKEDGFYESAYNNCLESEINEGTILAYQKAKKRFLESYLENGNMQYASDSDSEHFKKNNDLDCKFYKSAILSKFIMYNVYGDKIYKYDGSGTVSYIGTVSQNIPVATGDVITNSGIYVEMNFVLNSMGKDFDMPIKQYVDITSS